MEAPVLPTKGYLRDRTGHITGKEKDWWFLTKVVARDILGLIEIFSPTKRDAREDVNKAECCTALQVSVSAAGQQATVPLSLGLHQRDIASHLLRLGLEQRLFLGVRHLDAL